MDDVAWLASGAAEARQSAASKSSAFDDPNGLARSPKGRSSDAEGAGGKPQTSRQGGDGPALVHPGRGREWWALPGGRFAWTDDERLWVERGDRVAVVRLGPGVRLVAARDVVVAWDEAGRWVRLGDAIEVGDRGHVGADLRAERIAGAWHVDGVALPEGAEEARDLRPWRTGRGLVWASDGWVYRWDLSRPPRAIGVIRDGERWDVGPGGVVVVGGADSWTRAAPPGRSASPLPVALRADGWLRFGDDGTRLAGVTADGEHVRIALVAGTLLREGRTLPLDAGGTSLGPDGALPGRRLRVIEASWALDGTLLGGPGGVVWDLATGRPLFEPPALLLGATVATTDGWLTVGWEDGRGHWLDPHTGAIRDPFVVPLDEDDLVESAAADGAIAYVHTANGHIWRVERDQVAEVASGPDPARPPRKDRSLRAWPVEASVRVGDRLWAWNSDGLLITTPKL